MTRTFSAALLVITTLTLQDTPKPSQPHSSEYAPFVPSVYSVVLTKDWCKSPKLSEPCQVSIRIEGKQTHCFSSEDISDEKTTIKNIVCLTYPENLSADNQKK